MLLPLSQNTSPRVTRGHHEGCFRATLAGLGPARILSEDVGCRYLHEVGVMTDFFRKCWIPPHPSAGGGGICGVLPVLVCEGMLSELRALLDVDVEVFRLGAMCQC